jgi:hypothetical protein
MSIFSLLFFLLFFRYFFATNFFLQKIISQSVLTTPVNFWSMTDTCLKKFPRLLKKYFYWPPTQKLYGELSIGRFI